MYFTSEDMDRSVCQEVFDMLIIKMNLQAFGIRNELSTHTFIFREVLADTVENAGKRRGKGEKKY